MTPQPARQRPADRVGDQASLPRLALRKQEAAAALGLSDESFDRYVKNELAVIRIGSIRLYAVAELQRWLAERAEPTLRPGSAQPVAPLDAAVRASPEATAKAGRKR